MRLLIIGRQKGENFFIVFRHITFLSVWQSKKNEEVRMKNEE